MYECTVKTFIKKYYLFELLQTIPWFMIKNNSTNNNNKNNNKTESEFGQ